MSRFWDGHAKTIDLARFRAHDQYLSNADYHHEGIWRFLMQANEAARLRMMGEDDAFGCPTAQIGDWIVSRDLLDSLLEIRFLEHHLPRFGVRSLVDIGAGYGRLAHRLEQTHPELSVTCVDAVDVSRETCAIYRKHRKGSWKMNLAGTYDVAVNIHSWSECTPDEIATWLDIIDARSVPWLFVIPHGPDFSCRDAFTGSVTDRSYDGPATPPEFATLIQIHGWKLHAHSALFGRNYYLYRWEGSNR